MSFLGLLLAAALFVSSVVASQVLISALGHEPVPEDIGDVFDKATATVDYADRALQAEARGRPAPPFPDLLADTVATRVFFAVAAASTALLVLVVAGAARLSPVRIGKAAGMEDFRTKWVWQAFLWMLLAYVTVVAYSQLARAAGVDILVPDQQVPRAALRDPIALTLFGLLAVVAAPFGEEFLFRGLLFGGLSKWGFWPAALVSGFAFALSHADPGTLLPFTFVGGLFAWLFWRTRSLWPSILCHAYFNGASFALLALTR